MISSLPEGLPEFTLGWGVLQWGSTWLNQPNANKNHNIGDKWVYTREQARFILWFYAVDAKGDWRFERGVLERPKGWGKSPFLAALCCTELLGPVAFAGWIYKNGRREAVGKPRMDALVQIAAISEDQTNNTFSLIGEMLSGAAQAEYSLSLMLSQVQAPGGRKIMRVTASPKSIEGVRSTFACLDETHLWTPVERGPELAATIRRNLGKLVGRSIETTNAPVPGQGSVAEESHDTYEQMQGGFLEEMRLLFDTREVVVDDIYNKEECFPALVEVYGDAAHPETGWIDLERLWREINDPATREYDARRFYLNQRVQEEAQWIKDAQWAKAKRDVTLKKNHLITLGFAGVTRNGAAALVGFRPKDGALFLLGLWEKPTNLAHNVIWELPVARVDARVRKWMKQDRCRYLGANPATLQDVVGRWSVDFEDQVEGIWLNQKMKQAKMVDQFQEALFDERILHDGDENLARHIRNTHLEEATWGYTLRKDKDHSNRYIAAAQAAILAVEAAQIALEKGLLDPPPDGGLFGF